MFDVANIARLLDSDPNDFAEQLSIFYETMETIMAHYLSNHIAVAYGNIFGEMVAASQSLGFKVRVMRARSGKPI